MKEKDLKRDGKNGRERERKRKGIAREREEKGLRESEKKYKRR